jgi:GrpB-like predicted nucleotidyltransferase (UPF0157 family)
MKKVFSKWKKSRLKSTGLPPYFSDSYFCEMKQTIELVDYDHRWPNQFRELKAIYLHALGEQVISIEHVGSTSVPGLAAKPVLDIDIVVADSTGYMSL